MESLSPIKIFSLKNTTNLLLSVRGGLIISITTPAENVPLGYDNILTFNKTIITTVLYPAPVTTCVYKKIMKIIS